VREESWTGSAEGVWEGMGGGTGGDLCQSGATREEEKEKVKGMVGG
jgi:hypothetical protein